MFIFFIPEQLQGDDDEDQGPDVLYPIYADVLTDKDAPDHKSVDQVGHQLEPVGAFSPTNIKVLYAAILGVDLEGCDVPVEPSRHLSAPQDSPKCQSFQKQQGLHIFMRHPHQLKSEPSDNLFIFALDFCRQILSKCTTNLSVVSMYRLDNVTNC